MKKILFYPLTCNPPHFGHATAVKVALHNLEFDEVWIMPSGKRVDKEISTSLEDRKNMALLFVQYLQKEYTIPVVGITIAVDNTDSRYTHEIIMELKSDPHHEIFQLCGTDGFTGIKERVIGAHEKFVVIKRVGFELPESLNQMTNLTILDGGVNLISSTKIREMIKNGSEDYKKLVPENIATYIKERGLYL